MLVLLFVGPELAWAQQAAESAPAPQPVVAPPQDAAAWELPPVPPPTGGRDPYLDRLDAPPPGWFTNLELSVVRPHLRDRLVDNNVTAAPFAPNSIVVPPDARTDWTAEPKIEVGYRVPDGFGDFRVSYRFLVDDGTGQAHTRLDLNDVNFDYTTWEFSPWPHWEMNWTVGVKFASLFFDSHFTRPYLPDGTGGVTEEAASDSDYGAGPHTALALAWQTPCCGWSLYSRFEASELWVMTTQRFRETALTAGSPVSGYDSARKPLGVPIVGVQAGVQYEPPGMNHWNFFGGYEWEGWWSVGRLDLTGSRADLFQNGVFVRAEYTF